MQSSATNCLKARLKTTIQSPRLRRAGASGAVPELTAVDKSEAAGLGLGLAFSPLPEDQAHHRTDSARDDEARRESAACLRRQLPAQLGGDVGRLADLAAQGVDGAGERVALA